MSYPFRKSIFACYVVYALLMLAVISLGQSVRMFLPERHGEWQRVITSADSNIDVGAASLVLEPSGVVRATFRTSLSKSEESFEKPGVKYKTRLETIQFDSRTNSYRVLETALSDSSEKTVYVSGPRTEAKWRPMGKTAGKLFGAAVTVRPFGLWQIVDVRYADGRTVSAGEDVQIATLFGADVLVQFDRFWIGRNACTYPAYESGSIGKEKFREWTGKSLEDVGLGGEKVDALKISCEQEGESSELHYLFLGTGGRATLLSGGVLLDLESRK